jgi:hypothetical protein
MVRSALRGVVPVAAVCAILGVVVAGDGAVANAADTPPPAVSLTINPDGTAVWNGEPLPNEPALKDKLAHRTQQAPKLELDLRFHSVGPLNDSNRQTLLDILELTAQFGYVHVETTGSGARLTVLGPAAADTATPR